MFIPLTIAILRGVLSPASLAGKGLSSGKLRQAVRMLRLLPDSAEGVALLLQRVFEECQVHVELPASRFFPSFRHFQRSDDTACLCRLRKDEMEYYFLHLAYGDEPATDQGIFYQALLHAESRWLRLLLQEEISHIYSDADARMLLCEVLEEIYSVGADADEAALRGFMPEVCLQLKGALASLYLNLTVDFGYLLEPLDYLDYHSLLADARYQHSLDAREAWEYDVYQMGNKACGLVASEKASRREHEALLLYEKMQILCEGMGELTASSPLCRGMILLENFLFCLFCDLLADADREKGIRLLFSPDKLACWGIGLRDNLYSDHLRSREGRSACYCVQRQLDKRCFTFLSPRLQGEGSIPRMLRAYLCRNKELYEENYARSFISINSAAPLATVPVAVTGMNPQQDEIHSLLGFLDYMTAATDANADGKNRKTTKKEQEKKPTPAILLERLFFIFLCQGDISAKYCKSVVICAGRLEVVYGAIFYYQKKRGGKLEDYARFLLTVCADTNTELKNMTKNANRYRDAYENYAAEQNMKLLA
ncbi:hypothetical protein [Bacteroides rodentium]|uniref:hypothetical protein n=1 Tax=Bacteroides rodentium TaxID=691816 RepID=UPI000472C914|nr:hypothetical protein [Bacteroides rodentium]